MTHPDNHERYTSNTILLSRPTKRFLAWIAATSFVGIWVITVTKGRGAPSYERALSWVPENGIRAAWLLAGTGAIAILAGWINASVRFFVFGLYGLIQALFAAGIMTQAAVGREAIFLGAMQWIGYVFFAAAALLDRPPRTTEQRIK